MTRSTARTGQAAGPEQHVRFEPDQDGRSDSDMGHAYVAYLKTDDITSAQLKELNLPESGVARESEIAKVIKRVPMIPNASENGYVESPHELIAKSASGGTAKPEARAGRSPSRSRGVTRKDDGETASREERAAPEHR